MWPETYLNIILRRSTFREWSQNPLRGCRLCVSVFPGNKTHKACVDRTCLYILFKFPEKEECEHQGFERKNSLFPNLILSPEEDNDEHHGMG